MRIPRRGATKLKFGAFLKAHLFVESPGLSTTLQDLGRVGYQDIGVPVSGALDPIAFRIANELVGNTVNTAALEIRMVGPVVRIESESVRVALAGSDTAIEVIGGGARTVPAWQSARLMKGQILRVGPLRDPTTCYLAVEGGFNLPEVFGSYSTYLRGRIGGFAGRPLQAGDKLMLTLSSVADRDERYLTEVSKDGPQNVFRVVLGPQARHFTPEAIRIFLSSDYTISHQADRMGFRLEGPALEHSQGYNIISDGIATGAIQVPGTGQPIVLLADRQTTGGYPKIAVVISADLPRLARMGPGTKIHFQAVTVEDAEEIRRKQEQEIVRLLARIERAKTSPRLDSETLLAASLISGVVSGEE
jgi:biotin-dependent carboxylase-like uncharacterized protein